MQRNDKNSVKIEGIRNTNGYIQKLFIFCEIDVRAKEISTG